MFCTHVGKVEKLTNVIMCGHLQKVIFFKKTLLRILQNNTIQYSNKNYRQGVTYIKIVLRLAPQKKKKHCRKYKDLWS